MLDAQTITLWTTALVGAGAILKGVVKFLLNAYDEIRAVSALTLDAFGLVNDLVGGKLSPEAQNLGWCTLGAL